MPTQAQPPEIYRPSSQLTYLATWGSEVVALPQALTWTTSSRMVILATTAKTRKNPGTCCHHLPSLLNTYRLENMPPLIPSHEKSRSKYDFNSYRTHNSLHDQTLQRSKSSLRDRAASKPSIATHFKDWRCSCTHTSAALQLQVHIIVTVETPTSRQDK